MAAAPTPGFLPIRPGFAPPAARGFRLTGFTRAALTGGLLLFAGIQCPAQAIWVTDSVANTITEYSYSGVPQRTIADQYPGNMMATEYLRNVAQAPNGTLWVYDGTFDPYISNAPTDGSAWTSYANGLFETANNESYGGIAVSGDTVFVTNDLLGGYPSSFAVLAYNVANGTATNLGTIGSTALNLGGDGMLYVVNDGGYSNPTTISVFNPTTLVLDHQLTLSGSAETDLRGIAALPNGHMIIATWDGYLQEYNADGTLNRQIQLIQSSFSTPGGAQLNNVSVGADGSYLAGSRFGDVFVVNSQLTAYTHFNPSAPTIDGTFANPVYGPFGPLVVALLPGQSATYGQSFAWAVPSNTFSDPDPSPSLTYGASGLPPGLAFNPATQAVSGTPTVPGIYNSMITASDGAGRTANASLVTTIAKATATVILSGLTQAYDGTPKSVTVSTVPTGLSTIVTYNFISNLPIVEGSYTVHATVNDPRYQGSATGTLEIVNEAPSITEQPVSQSTVVGRDATFSVAASGSPTLSYQWTFNGANIAGANGPSFTVSDAQLADAGSYAVVVANPAGTVTSSSASLAVSPDVVAPAIAIQPGNQTAAAGLTAVFWATASGTPPLACQWNLNGTPIPGATGVVLTLNAVSASEAGTYTMTASNSAGSATSAPATLTVGASGSGTAPQISLQPASQTMNAGSTEVFGVAMAGATTQGSSVGGPKALALAPAPGGAAAKASGVTYQWFRNGAPLAGAAESLLVIGNATPANDGSYSCLVTNSAGAVFSSAARLTVVTTANPGHLTNLSCRASVGTGANILIAGFVVGGAGTTGSDPFLIRSSGPALVPFGVAGTLPDPQLLLYAGAHFVGSNSGWAGNAQIANASTLLGAFAWVDPQSSDSALLETLSAGPYSAQVSGQSGDTGVALAEIYDARAPGSYTPAAPRLINISARVAVGTGGDVLIAGFVIGGATSKTVLIRASRPALKAFGVSGVLPDPALQLYTGTTLLGTNTGWAGDPQIGAAAAAVGGFSWGAAATPDSAILVTLPPGAYTAQVSGASGGSGVALVEVYDVP